MTSKSSVVQVILSAKDQDLVSTMVKAELATQRFGEAAKKQQSSFEQMGKSLETLKRSVTGFIGFEIGMKVFEAFNEQVKIAKEYVKAGAEFNDLLQRQAANLSITTQAMAAFTAMEVKADLESGSLTASLAKMQQFIAGAGDYSSKSGMALKELGIKFDDIINLSADEQFKIIAEALSHVENKTKLAGYASDIFGKQYKGLVSTLKEGKGAFDDATAQAQKLGLILSETQKARLDVIERQQKELDLLIKGNEQRAAAASAEASAAEIAVKKVTQDLQAARSVGVNKIASESEKSWASFLDFLDVAVSSQAAAQSGIAIQVEDTGRKRKAVEAAITEVQVAEAKAREFEETRIIGEEQRKRDDLMVAFVHKQIATEAKLRGDAMVERMQQTIYAGKIESDYDKVRVDNLKKAINSLSGANEVVNKYYSDMAKAKKDAMSQSMNGFVGPVGMFQSEIDQQKAMADQTRKFHQLMLQNELTFGVDQVTQENARYAAQLQSYKDLLNSKKIALDQYNELNIAAGKKHDENIAAAEARKDAQRLSQASSFFGNLDTLTAQSAKQSESFFWINKAVQMAQAEVNAWLAFSNIMGNTNILGMDPISAETVQVTMAGMALAAGQMAVGQIAAVQPAGRANGGPVSRGSMYQVNERGPELLSVGDRTFLMMGNKGGSVQPIGAGSGPKVEVSFHNHAPDLTSARIERSGTDQEPHIDIILERVEE